MKKNLTTIILVIMLVAGLSLMLYPTFANWWNSFHGVQVIQSYDATVAEMNAEEKEQLIKDAKKYNKDLAEHGQYMELSKEQKKRYEKMLRIENEPVMGSLYIPKINVNLPIYHGTSDMVLGMGIGHLEWSSLPVGGKSTHCVLSGHRGLPSAKLLTDLDEMKEGDYFVITVLDQTITYEVDQIRTVLPKDTTELMIEDGKDYCTLFTCTPYGINTHRLLVRGHRIANIYDANVRNEAMVIEPIFSAGVIALIFILILLIIFLIRTGKKKEKKDKEEKKEKLSIGRGKKRLKNHEE